MKVFIHQEFILSKITFYKLENTNGFGEIKIAQRF